MHIQKVPQYSLIMTGELWLLLFCIYCQLSCIAHVLPKAIVMISIMLPRLIPGIDCIYISGVTFRSCQALAWIWGSHFSDGAPSSSSRITWFQKTGYCSRGIPFNVCVVLVRWVCGSYISIIFRAVFKDYIS